MKEKVKDEVPGGPSLKGAFVIPYVICHMTKRLPVAETITPPGTQIITDVPWQ